MKILLPVDGSAHALAAVRHALALRTAGLQAGYVLANVQEPPSLYEMVVTHDADTLAAIRSGAGSDQPERPPIWAPQSPTASIARK